MRRGVFLVHEEDAPLKALQSSLHDLVRAHRAIIPEIDDIYDVTGENAVRVDHHEQRLPGSSAGHRDWHNDYATMLLEISDAIEAAADKRAKAVLIQQILQALKDGAKE